MTAQSQHCFFWSRQSNEAARRLRLLIQLLHQSRNVVRESGVNIARAHGKPFVWDVMSSNEYFRIPNSYREGVFRVWPRTATSVEFRSDLTGVNRMPHCKNKNVFHGVAQYLLIKLLCFGHRPLNQTAGSWLAMFLPMRMEFYRAFRGRKGQSAS